MQSPNNIIEDQHRRPFHMAVGTFVLFAAYTVVVVAVRTILG
jgi:hypothetical protein